MRASPLLAGLLLTALAASAAAAATASQVLVPPIPFRERVLANGLHVYSAVDRTTPNVTVQVYYRVGGKDDPEGRSGFAHLFEHMMFKSTRDMPSEFMDRLTEDVGGFNNASTSDDFTNYYEVAPSNRLQRLLWAEAERMSSLQVDQKSFASERSVVEEELRQRVLANPYGRLQSIVTPEASFHVHPYKRPVIGSIADLDAAQLADVQAFHATYYRPDNADLIVIGNFDPAMLDRWIDGYFGSIRHPAAAIPRVTAIEPPRTAPSTVIAYGPNVPLPAVSMTFAAPAASSPDGAALDVVDALLTTGRASRLYHDLVYDRQLAQDVFSSADLRQQPGLFAVGMVLASGHTPDEGEAALRGELARLRDAPVGDTELARAKNQLLAQVLKDRETIDGRASALGQALVLEGDAARVNSDIAAIQAVTAADVQRVARAYLRDETRVVIRYLPDSARPPSAPVASPARASPPVAASPLTAAAAPAPPNLPHDPPAPGPLVAPIPPRPASRTLANGLKVIVARHPGAPLTTLELIVRSGSTSDPAGLGGLQSLTASLLTQGAGARTASQLSDAVEALGGSLESAGGTDGSQVVLTTLADQAPQAAEILADVVRRPALAAAELERLRRQRIDELSVQMQEPGALARLAVRPVVFGASPYGHGPGGTPASLARIDRATVQRQYAAAYRPDNAVLVIAGDVTPEFGFHLAEHAFGDWERPAAPPSIPVIPSPAPKPRVVVLDLPGTGQAAVLAVGPSIARTDPRFYAAEVASAVLGGGFSARLNTELRIKRGLSYGASADLEEFRQTGLFIASAQTSNASAPEAAALVLQEITDLPRAPLPSPELEAREAAIVGEFGRSTATTSGLAGQIAANYALYGVDADEIARLTQRMDAVSADEAKAAASSAISAPAASLIIAGDAKTFIGPLRARFPDAVVIPAGRLDMLDATAR